MDGFTTFPLVSLAAFVDKLALIISVCACVCICVHVHLYMCVRECVLYTCLRMWCIAGVLFHFLPTLR